jgi:hypothetical protein
MPELFFALTTESGVSITTEDGEAFGYLIRQFADSLEDQNFRRPLTHVYEEFRKRQEVKLASVVGKTTVGRFSTGAAALLEIDVAIAFIKTGRLSASAGTQFLMRSLTVLHTRGAVNAQGLKDITEEELIALIESSL